MKLSIILGAIGLSAIFAQTHAASFSRIEVNDPIVEGAACQVDTAQTYGSYIFELPSRFDQVFWPVTDERGLWFCETSGFVGINHDFDDLSDEEITQIRAYLAEHYRGDSSMLKKLRLLDAIYEMREKPDEFRVQLWRLLAWHYERMGDFTDARYYRQRALIGMRSALNGELDPRTRAEYLFVAATYEKELGNPLTSDEMYRLLEASLVDVELEGFGDYANYLRRLVAEAADIYPGGRLAPEYH